MGAPRARTPRSWTAWLCGAVIVGAGLTGAPAQGAGAANARLAVPGAPTVTSVTPGVRAIAVAFKKPASDGGSRISSYRVVCNSYNGGASGSHQGFSSPITVSGLTAGKTYSCTVAAINKVAIGPPSSASTAVVTLPTVPAAPTIVKLTPGFHNVAVSFKATTNGGAPITNYRVTCKDDDGTKSHQAFTSPITIACVNGAETYTCAVAAYNRIGWGPSSPTSNAAISLPVTPGPPKITGVTAQVRGVALTVAAPVNDGGVRITGLRATCTSSNGGVPGTHQNFTSPVAVAGLSAGKTYTCTVAALNKVSTGPPSPPSPPFIPLS